MTRFALALLAAAFTAPALAQDAPPPASPADATAPSGPGGAKGNVKELRAQCRAEAQSQGLKGEARWKAVSDCVVKARPDLAGREQCRMDGLSKGLRKDELHAFVKDCAKKG